MSYTNGLGRIVGLVQAYREARILFVAARLGLFDLLERRPRSLEGVCRGLKLSPRPTRLFLDALVAMGLLVRAGRLYANSAAASRYLIRGVAEDFGSILRWQDMLWPAWGELGGVLARGIPRRGLQGWMRAARGFTREYVTGMRWVARRPAEAVARRLGGIAGRRLLDVGAGTGDYSLALLRRAPGLQADLLDLPDSLRVTRRLWRDEPLRTRIRLVPGDYRRLAATPRHYDTILLSNVTHNEGAGTNRRMLARCARALAPGGRVAVHDFMTHDSGAAPAFDAVFGVFMATFNREGAVYRERDYRSWLRGAGFRRVIRHSVVTGMAPASVLLIAQK